MPSLVGSLNAKLKFFVNSILANCKSKLLHCCIQATRIHNRIVHVINNLSLTNTEQEHEMAIDASPSKKFVYSLQHYELILPPFDQIQNHPHYANLAGYTMLVH